PPPADRRRAAHEWRPSPGYLAVALEIVAVSLVLLLMPSPSPTAVAADVTPPATLPVDGTPVPGLARAAESSPAPAAPVRAAAATRSPAPAAPIGATATVQRVSPGPREPDGDPTPDLSDYVNPGERPTMAEVIDRLHLAGVHWGLGAFSPPGTRPPLVGLAVPEDFVLPEGYVRHYQATDDGQRIEPILMFSPDHQFVDAAGAPIAIPKDRVVPPELAPPGLPMRRIVIPAPIEPERPGR
ncbi:MAG: hypothetical protein ACM3N6_02650, partial [Betaproteobacteria bacterium]